MVVKYKIATAIIVNNKGEVLLSKRGRDPFKGCWALVSGVGESKKGYPPEIGVIAEVLCDLGTKSFKGDYFFSLPVENDEIIDGNVVFVGTVNVDEIVLDPIYSQEIKWVSPNSKEEFENLAFEHSLIIKKYLEQT